MIKVSFTKFIEKITNYEIGCFLFFHLVLRSTLIINIINFLTDRNIKHFVEKISNILAGKKLVKMSLKLKSIEKIFALLESYQYSLNIPKFLIYKINLPILQNKFEIIKFIKIIDTLKPRYILEIGTALGGTLFLLSRFSNKKAEIISIDLPKAGGSFGGGYFEYRTPFLKAFARRNQKIILLRSNSHKLSTLKKIKEILNNRELDLLFIDGDHSYKGVKKDFEMYRPLVKPGGVICFHDIVPGIKEHVGGVPKFWKDINSKFSTQEIVDKWDQGGFGIGIIFLKK